MQDNLFERGMADGRLTSASSRPRLDQPPSDIDDLELAGLDAALEELASIVRL
jgi:hypothetical protein